jgi:hypothetical protein
VRTAFGGYTPELPVTAWDPPKRFAYSSGKAEDGRFVAYEFLIEGRGGGSTVLRIVTSGFLPGDDWEAEYDAMTKGGELFFRTLVTYLTHFPGRTATPSTAFGPPVSDWEHAWTVLRDGLGLTGAVTEGTPVRFAPDGLPPIDGVVYFINPHTLGVRTGDAIQISQGIPWCDGRRTSPLLRQRGSGGERAGLAVLAHPAVRTVCQVSGQGSDPEDDPDDHHT